MKTQHTPGPWRVIDGIGCGSIYSIQAENPPAGNGVLAAILHAPDKQTPLLIAKHNANLIAAAPDLLEACKAMEIALSEAPCISNKQEASRIQARQAIRKAEGKE